MRRQEVLGDFPLNFPSQVIPSNSIKLCMIESRAAGVLDRGATGTIRIVTNAMVPYKYVDIAKEAVYVAFAPVELYRRETGQVVQNPCQCLWDKLVPAEVDHFWTLHPPGTGPAMGVSKIMDFQAADSAFLAEESVMWAECKVWKYLKDVGRCVYDPMFGWRAGTLGAIHDFFHCVS